MQAGPSVLCLGQLSAEPSGIRPQGLQSEVKICFLRHTSCSLLVSLYLNVYSQFLYFIKCEQNAIPYLKIAQTGLAELWMAEAAPHGRALSGLTGWRGKAKLCVGSGVYHWKSMKVQGADSWTALYFAVQGHCVSPEVFYLWTSHIMFPHRKWRAWSEDSAWMLLGGSYLWFLFCCCCCCSWKHLKAKMIMGYWIKTRCFYNWCLVLGILPVTWMDDDDGLELLGRL